MRVGRATLAALAMLVALPAAASGAERLPVPWTFDAGIAAQGAAPDSPPPGANDFDCEPSERRPHPVVLVHGLAANQTVNWQTLSPFLANRGFCVFSLTYGEKENVSLGGFYQPGGLVPMERSARQLAGFVKKVRRATGAERVDIVGHSEGSLMPNQYVKFNGGAKRVSDYVGITPLWDGTDLAGLGGLAHVGEQLGIGQALYDAIAPACESCPQFLVGSEFLEKLNEGGIAASGVRYTNIVTKNDQLVIPYTSGLMDEGPRITNHVVQDQCAEDQADHIAVAADPIVAYDVLNALDRKHPRPVPCVPVTYGVGAVGYSGN
jgi:triacylglycerol esterase/lipase EstA (alpha/beta hydrolase family)